MPHTRAANNQLICIGYTYLGYKKHEEHMFKDCGNCNLLNDEEIEKADEEYVNYINNKLSNIQLNDENVRNTEDDNNESDEDNSSDLDYPWI